MHIKYIPVSWTEYNLIKARPLFIYKQTCYIWRARWMSKFVMHGQDKCIVLKEAFMIGIRLLVYTDYRQIILHSYFLVVFTLYYILS